MTADQLRDAAREVLDEEDLSQSEVARAPGVHRSTISVALSSNSASRYAGTLRDLIEELTDFRIESERHRAPRRAEDVDQTSPASPCRKKEEADPLACHPLPSIVPRSVKVKPTCIRRCSRKIDFSNRAYLTRAEPASHVAPPCGHAAQVGAEASLACRERDRYVALRRIYKPRDSVRTRR
jgi:hypothetical protein